VIAGAFRGGTACRRTNGSGTLGEVILLLLEREKDIDPFQDEQMLKNTQGQGAVMKWIPVDGVKHRDFGPVVMPACRQR
jgi:hypothetical protein